MYFTKEGKPPSKGFTNPVPKRPSTNKVEEVSCGGSNSFVTSMKLFRRLQSIARCLFS